MSFEEVPAWVIACIVVAVAVGGAEVGNWLAGFLPAWAGNL